jgi:hypothetical protein
MQSISGHERENFPTRRANIMVERPNGAASFAFVGGLPAKVIDDDGELSHALFGLAPAENGLKHPCHPVPPGCTVGR